MQALTTGIMSSVGLFPRLAVESHRICILLQLQVEATWEDLCRQMLTIRQVFLYMDRSFIMAAPGVRSLFDMGLQLFRTHLAHHPAVCLCCFLLLFETCTLSSAGVLSSASCLSGPCDGAGGGAALTVPSLKDMTTPHAAAMLAKCGRRMCGLPFERRRRMAWQVGSKTTAGLLQLIRAERNGDTVNRLLLAHLLQMLSALGIYQTSFQVLD